MSNVSFFQEVLAEVKFAGEESVIHALAVMNLAEEVHRVPFFSDLIDLVYTYEDKSYLLVKFDFLPGEVLESRLAWLADEEQFNDAEPLYFSESSHRISPAYKLRQAGEVFRKLNPDARDIHLLLVCNYHIINYEDICDEWAKWGMQVVHNVEDTSHSVFHPTEKDKRQNPCLIAEKPLPKPKTKAELDKEKADAEFDEEFERLLNSAQEQWGKSDTDEDDENEEENEEEWIAEDEEDTTDYSNVKGEWVIREVHLYNQDNEAFTTFNIRTVQRITVAIEGYYSIPYLPDNTIVFNLYNDLGQLLVHQAQQITLTRFEDKYGEHWGFKVQQLFDPANGFSWTKGRYVIEVLHGDETLHPITFTIRNKSIAGPIWSERENYSPTPFDKLNKMIGLQEVKERMAVFQSMNAMNDKCRKSHLIMPTPPIHAIFTGHPGLGKKTVASYYANILCNAGLIRDNQVIFVESSKVFDHFSNSLRDSIQEAKEKGCVICITDANLLYKFDQRDQNTLNALDTIATTLGDKFRTNWAMVLIGSADGMGDMLGSNPVIASNIPERNRYHFKDLTFDELMQFAYDYCERNNYVLNKASREALHQKIHHDYQLRDKNFAFARYVTELFTSEILPTMSMRINTIASPSLYDLLTIEKEDIPCIQLKDYRIPLQKLHDMIGLEELKHNITNHINMIRFALLRNEQGIRTDLPPLHMVFTGNPGTGKTTVASFIGEIYAALGLLSKGNLIYVERQDLVGQFIGDTEKKTADVLNRAKGNVLFIDEAYSLAPVGKDDRDFGKRVIETLLSTLSKERVDMIVILAGYPQEMKNLLKSNPGLESRFSYTLNFPDYNGDELMQIADSVAKNSGYIFSPSAREELETVVNEHLEKKTEHWGNARFITRFISAHILPAMSTRLTALPAEKLKSKKRLCTICKEDIIAANQDAQDKKANLNEKAITRTLKKLDALVGLEEVKQNIHNFVKVVRYMHNHNEDYSTLPLRWNFTGNTGTGKSTVACIMGELLKAMNLLQKGHIVEIRGEELYSSTTLRMEEILGNAMKKSAQGLLYIDGDAPVFKQNESLFNSDALRLKLTSTAMENQSNYALIIAENETDQHVLSRNLRKAGLHSFDHTMHFADYTEEELLAILKSSLERKHLHLSDTASAHIATYIHALCMHKKLGYANARTISKIANAIMDAYVVRISSLDQEGDGEVLLADVKSFVWQEGLGKRSVGFE